MRDTGLILLIGGRSSRAKLSVKKQFYPVDGEAVFIHTVRAMLAFPFARTVIVAPPEDRSVAIEHLAKAGIDIPVVDGGDDRTGSVQNGLNALASSGIAFVFIHDGVRPLVPKADLSRLDEAVHLHSAAILAAPVTDTIKTVNAESIITGSPERSSLWRALTPQAFDFTRYRAAMNAYRADEKRVPATDDASIYAAYDGPVHIVPGDPYNIKITEAQDIDIFRMLKNRRDSVR